eukprot:2243610-Rhodomonas_salina.1
MSRLGSDPSAYDGRSCRIGALSTCADKRVPGYLICLQSGHSDSVPDAATSSSRRYMLVRSPKA